MRRQSEISSMPVMRWAFEMRREMLLEKSLLAPIASGEQLGAAWFLCRCRYCISHVDLSFEDFEECRIDAWKEIASG
jgi:hypothetical protein